jgi:hypothetical protein
MQSNGLSLLVPAAGMSGLTGRNVSLYPWKIGKIVAAAPRAPTRRTRPHHLITHGWEGFTYTANAAVLGYLNRHATNTAPTA